jgi:error-prone DNA polymerase
MSGFAHLHTHSGFSFMDGVPSPRDLVTRAADLGMEAIALTDHQGLYGAVRFYKEAIKAGVRPIVGCEVCMEPAGAEADAADLPPEERLPAPPPVGSARARGEGYHLTLLARDMEGYRDLCRLLSRAHVRSGDEPSTIGLADLERHSAHLIGLSGCGYGEASMAVRAGRPGHAARALTRLARCFPAGEFYVELMDTLTPGSVRTVATLADIAESLKLPIVATNDVHYLERSQARLHDVLASAGALMSLPGPFERPNAELWMKPGGEMRRLFERRPAACDATLEIAERCELDMGLGAFHFPAARVSRGETPYSVLSKLAWRGLEERYRPMIPEAVRRLSHELSVIGELGFPEYFLVVNEIVGAARERGIRCSGRGSAGDSIVAYALGITDADPVAHDLLFERFLNPQRRQMPDIDVDFDSARRDEVIEFIYDRFGRDRVAMVATVNRMSAKGAVRTVARAFGHAPKEMDELSRYLPWTSMAPREAIRAFPECRNHPLHDEKRYGLLLDLADELIGTPMHLGTHLGGFIITKEPVDSWTPLQWAAKGVVVSQYDKDDVEALGLVKMDILGLRMHSAISEAVEMARERVGAAAVPEPFTLSKDDPAVYDMIAAADTVGTFQLESSGQRNLARRLRQRDFEDIISAISLFRPGPMEADMVNPFIRRRHGMEPVTLPHPSMERAVGDTYGVIIYQEQVLRVAEAVAGFDLAEADSLRRAMTKDRSVEEMAAIGEHFVERAVARGVPEDAAREIFRQLKGFAAYGFNKAHGACFAVISYGSAWLKHYYPAEFAAAILNNEPMGFYSPRCVLGDARRTGIEVLGLDVNEEDPGAHRRGARGAAVPGPRGLHAARAARAARGGEPRAGGRARRSGHHRRGPAAHP